VPFQDAFPIFQTADLARALTFYRDLFGFEEHYRFPEDAPEFVVVVLGPFSLGLSAVDEIAPAGRVALWLYCDDVDERSLASARRVSRSSRSPRIRSGESAWPPSSTPTGTRSTSGSGVSLLCESS
jgi:hypothetical protein